MTVCPDERPGTVHIPPLLQRLLEYVVFSVKPAGMLSVRMEDGTVTEPSFVANSLTGISALLLTCWSTLIVVDKSTVGPALLELELELDDELGHVTKVESVPMLLPEFPSITPMAVTVFCTENVESHGIFVGMFK